MNIIIVGMGKVGFEITKQLDEEGHDITVIDNNVAVLNKVTNQLDVDVVLGSGGDTEVLMASKVDQADLVIAATSSDEINIICCFIAKKMGASHTIARIRNPQYRQTTRLLKEELGLSMSINPEEVAAREILKSLSYPSQIKVNSFANGKSELVEFKIVEHSPLIGLPIHKINFILKTNVLFCAIERKDEIHIPEGSTIIEQGDKITFTGSTKDIEKFLYKNGIQRTRPLREVMIVGGGKITFYLTRLLLDLGIDVRIIEKNKDRCLNLVEQFPQATIIQGDGTDHEFLMSESLQEMDSFIALTDNDEENVIVCMFASKNGVSRVLPKINRVSLGFLLEKLGLQNAITPKILCANQIAQYVRAMQNSVGSNVESLMTIMDSRVEILEFRIRDNCKFIGKPLKEVQFKKDILIGYYSRKGIITVAKGDSVILKGDTVVIFSLKKGLRDINDVLDK
ncbi:Trk system potassium transporter TrkA [Floccifex sp.]|uniref:Trk system potassium transporter TrkA n=1 Tax=Floccifex sp. TaxID=2815810 RepID=UPI003EFC6A55